MDQDIDAQVREAQQGSKEALEQVILFAQGYVYNLALRMLRRPIDAEDVTQDILIRIVTHLATFRGESAFTTWIYRIASNVLLNHMTRVAPHDHVTFDGLAHDLETSLRLASDSAEDEYADAELTDEIRRSCTFSMLHCLDPIDRLALILGELMGVSGEEGAAIMEISPAAFRKRLSRARSELVMFVSTRCGIVNQTTGCRCHVHIRPAIAAGRLDPAHLRYASQPHTPASLAQAQIAENQDAAMYTRAMALIRAHPEYQSRLDTHTFIAHLFTPNDPDA